MLMENVEQSIVTMQSLSDLGIRIAVDYFGTGYSSLSYLGKFPISELKIDHSFVRNIFKDASEAVFVQSIISLAGNPNLDVTAEGVETAEQCDFLKENGCDIIQGYYFSKPLPANELAHFLYERTRKPLSQNV